MSWKDYETLDTTRETATEEEMKALRRKYNLPVGSQSRNVSMRMETERKENSLKKKDS